MECGYSSAYLKSYTKEKVCIFTKPDFGPLIGKSLNVLRSSGQRWYHRFEECIEAEGFKLYCGDPNI